MMNKNNDSNKEAFMSTAAVNIAAQNSIELIDWSQVRSVYRKLHTDFHVLTKPFDIEISGQMNQDLAHLISLIDAVDRDLDELSVLADRQTFGQAVVAYLKSDRETIETTTVSAELALRPELFKRNCRAAKHSRRICRSGCGHF